ncbi:MAG: NADH-quinone oxidoreductase subunit A [Chloracidobacterium sp.]|uniref:NADH-quinone oxidoreductase subunit A n=1 Tax=Chloracidobacterium validum TaxID=2821543 RepID=A0ABX8B6U5_9BACT|nr:NADH-quinone oxidoreductase subunit A [Chloracidobacterium validum]QUW02389.1 NADH-quinone oxidoreductase subunit A [Chloracidobacterium validum]
MVSTVFFLLQQAAVDTPVRGPIMGYIPIVILFVIALAIPLGALTVGRFFRRTVMTPEKMMAYECGVDPVSDARERISVRYFIIAMLFLIFDVETIFLFPWAVIYDQLALFGLIEAFIFIGILIVGYYYAWRKGALDWV